MISPKGIKSYTRIVKCLGVGGARVQCEIRSVVRYVTNSDDKFNALVDKFLVDLINNIHCNRIGVFKAAQAVGTGRGRPLRIGNKPEFPWFTLCNSY